MSSTEVQYGYLLLERECSSGPYSVTAVCSKLFANMWDCITEASTSYNLRSNPNSVKIAYFQVMSNGAIVKSLHATCRLEEATL